MAENTLRLRADVAFQAAADVGPDGKPKLPTFKIKGYTGAVMNVAGFYSPVVVDLAGLKAASQTIPALFGHSPDQIVGQTTAVKISAAGAEFEGVITGENSYSQEVVSQARNGFRWQASIGANIDRREFLDAGKKATVNGREVTGPMTIARQASVFEISFVPIGADSKTSAAVAAKKGAHMPPEITTETETDPIQEERSRISAIRAACRGEFRDLEARAIDEGWSIEATKGAVLDQLRANRQIVTPAPYSRTQPDLRAGFSVKDRMTAALMVAGGHGEKAVKLLPGGEQLVNSTQRFSGWPELAAHALQLAGLPVPSDRNELLKASFSTTSMPNALGSSIEKAALTPFLEVSHNWLAIARIVSATSFKAGKAVRLAASTQLDKVGPGGEIKSGSLSEDAFDYKLDTYARMIGVTRQDLINDDLSILADLPTVLGGEAARTAADLVFSTLTANANTFYGSGHKNVTTGVLDVNGLGTAVKTLRTQTDGDKRIIGFQPTTLLVPAAIEAVARQIVQSQLVSRSLTSDQVPTANPWLEGVNLAVEPRLDANSATQWYLFAQAFHGAVLVALLNGRQGIIVEDAQMTGDMLGWQWRAYMDMGVSLGEWRATVRSSGV